MYLPWPQGSNLSLSPSTYSSKQIAHVSYGSPNNTNQHHQVMLIKTESYKSITACVNDDQPAVLNQIRLTSFKFVHWQFLQFTFWQQWHTLPCPLTSPVHTLHKHNIINKFAETPQQPIIYTHSYKCKRWDITLQCFDAAGSKGNQIITQSALTNNKVHFCITWGVSRTFSYEILIAASAGCSSHIIEVASCYEVSQARNFFATFCYPAHKMVTSMPLTSKSGQIMASIEFSHLSISHFRKSSQAVEPRFSYR